MDPAPSSGRSRGALFVSYEEAKARVQRARITTAEAYLKWKRPAGMPSAPDESYRGAGWISWGEFLGTGRAVRQHRRKFMPYWKAQEIVREAGVLTQKAFYAWARPERFPSNPRTAYTGYGWTNWAEFFGTNDVSYEEAVRVVRKAGITTFLAFRAWDLPVGIPSAPDRTYADSGWVNWGTFLGTGNQQGWQSGHFISFAAARKRVRESSVPSSTAYFAWERPEGLPRRPDLAYKGKGWRNWSDYLGNGRKPRGGKRPRKR